MLDILIINGEYPDFERNAMITGDIGIKNGRIVSIGATEEKALKVIDAKGKIVSPGFIDIHMHEEDFANEGEAYVIANMMLQMGVTTCLGGNCGVQKQPLKQFKQTIDKLGGAPVNYLMLAGYNYYRTQMGIGRYDLASSEQQEALKDKLREELAEGAYGISLGLEYDPGITLAETLNALSCSDDGNLLVAVHYRSDSTTSIDSVHEMVEIAEKSGKKFQISHLSSCSAMGQMEEALSIINEAIDKNPKINYDTYPYNAFSTHIGSAVFDDGCLESWGKDYDSLLLTDDPYKNQFCTEELFRKVRKEYPKMLVVAFVMNEAEIAGAIANRHGMVASDGIIQNGNGHPRAAGTFPRVLGKYVREDQVVSLIDALRKITLEPAKRLDLDQKARIQIGCDADLTIFDPTTIKDGATFESLHIKPTGIDWVIVNGKVALQDSEIVEDRLGKFIAYPNAQ